MKKGKWCKSKSIFLTIGAVFFILFFIIPITFSIFDGSKYGNVALIPIEGMITGNGGKYLGQTTVSSKEIVKYIESANEDEQIKAIVLEINSPGGSAVASDEIAAAVKKSKLPVISQIREVGASGGYWIASATEQIISNRMSITGSIGVISSYLEFSGLMEEYGISHQRMVAGKYKDVGSPLRKLKEEEEKLLQKKINRIHEYFIEEISENRNLEKDQVKKIATGEFYLGVEALNLGLVDQLGDKETVKEYLKNKHQIIEVDYVVYQKESGFLEMLSGVFSEFFFNVGEGFGSILTMQQNQVMLV
jgi:protease-4